MKWPKVSIIIINWNGLDWLKICLPSLAKVTYPNFEVIVVDNGSDDGSIDYLKQTKIVIKIIQNKTNLGFAEPNNQGIRAATGEYILFLNNDMKYDPNFIQPLIKAFEDPTIGAVQPKMLRLNGIAAESAFELEIDHNRAKTFDKRRCLADKLSGGDFKSLQPNVAIYEQNDIRRQSQNEPQKLDGVGSYLTIYGILLHFGFGKPANLPVYNKERDIFTAKGAAMLVKKSVLDKTGGFDKDYFAYFEETDLCWRIWLAGYRIRYIPTSLVYHAGGETAKRISTFAHYHSFKNRLTTLIKNLQITNLIWMLTLHLFLIGLVAFAYLLIGQVNAFLASLKAVWWNLINLSQTLNKRRDVQTKIRKVNDKKLFSKILRPLPLNYFYYLFTARLEDWPEPKNI